MTTRQELRHNLIAKRISARMEPHYLDTLKLLHTSILNGLEHLETLFIDPLERLGFYYPIRGEPAISEVLIQWQQAHPNRTIGLPVTTPHEPLQFFSWTQSTAMRIGYGNIPEPEGTDPMKVDILIAPCVGWVVHSNRFWRLGFGGGFYDRTMQHLHQLGKTPFLIGLGFDNLQVPDTLWEPQEHDWPLDMLITPSGFRCHTQDRFK